VTRYTRVTVQGEGRKADLVLPDDEPIAAMLPDVLALLDESGVQSARPVVLVTTVGDQLDLSLTLAEQVVEHGTILRIVRVEEAPPPPEVADVTDVAADALQSRADIWRPIWGVLAAAALAVVLGALAAAVAAQQLRVSLSTLLEVCAALVLAAVLLARRAHSGPAVIGTAAATGIAAVVASGFADRFADGGVGTSAVIWFGLACVIVGVVGTAGFRDVALGLGGAIGIVLVGSLALLVQLGWERADAAAIIALFSTAILGLLPGIAMSITGLNGLDDRILDGRRVARAAANRVVAVSGAAALLLAGDPDIWSRLLTVVIAATLLLRTRVLPLAPQRLALLAAGAAPLVALLATLSRSQPGRGLAVIAALILLLGLLVGVQPGERTMARVRRLANVVELIAVVSLVPLVLGVLGVFADLLGTF
jgi:hypothetical protein